MKFSEEYGCIDVTVAEKDDKVVVTIGNTGKPIAPESLKRIFHKFYQADESHASQGNGLGLAIVEKVVQLHQGAVSVRSDPMLTTFTVELPRHRPGQKTG